MIKNRLKKLAQIQYKSGNLDLYNDTIFTIAQITVGNNRDYEYRYDEGKDVFIVTKDNKNDGKNYVGSEYGPTGSTAYGYQRIIERGRGQGVDKAKAKQDERKRKGEFTAVTFEDVQRQMQQAQQARQNQGQATQGQEDQTSQTGEQPTGSYPNSVQNGLVKINRGVDVANISPTLSKFIEELGIVAQKLGAEKPVITSGYRNHASQANIMISNWKRNGGLNGGLQYMSRLYGENLGPGVDAIMRRHKIGTSQEQASACQAEMVNFLKANFRGQHTLSPSQAVDVRSSTDKIYEVLQKIVADGKVRINIGDERWTRNPHFHISV